MAVESGFERGEGGERCVFAGAIVLKDWLTGFGRCEIDRGDLLGKVLACGDGSLVGT